MRDRLDPAYVQAGLENCAGWALSPDHLTISQNFIFGSFAEAFGFMAEVAIIAEKIDHHPEWTNIWRKVAVTLTTHSAKGLTELDFVLAKAMNEIAKKRLVLP